VIFLGLVYYVYYSHQKIIQLYRQLAESRVVMQKSSTNRNSHLHADLHPLRQPHEEDRRHMQQCMSLSRLDNSGSESCYKELCYDKNEMYMLDRVLRALRKCGQLVRAKPGAKFCPGKYYELEGCFSPEEGGAPAGYLWLRAPAGERGPAVRLLCHRNIFTGENEGSAFREIWACGDTLPLCGIALSLGCGEALCGLPLVLWLK